MIAFSNFSLDPLNITGILVAVICGLAVGLERQWSGKPAGIRTSILICLGAYTFVALAAFYQNEAGDSTRVLGQIVTGIGFLGAGVMLTRDGLVVGVTSAAIIWILAAIGCLIGFDNYSTALVLTFTTIIVLVGINFLEKVFRKLRRGAHNKKAI